MPAVPEFRAGTWSPVASDLGYVSLWPAGRRLPVGWCELGPPMDRAAALEAAVSASNQASGAAAGPPRRSHGIDTVIARFTRHARRSPDKRAVIDADAVVYTYGQLEARARGVQTALTDMGIVPGDTVGVCMDRSADLVAVLLGILSSGAAYVPLDGSYPEGRLRFMSADARLAVIVSGPRYIQRTSATGVPVLGIADIASSAGTSGRLNPGEPDSLAYVIYTSGSTGEPKGVEATHRNLAAFLDAMAMLLPTSAAARVLFSTQISFDIAGLEIFFPLTMGGACLVAPHTWLLDRRSLTDLINSAAPSLVQATPVGWRLLLDGGARFTGGQVALCGGDALPPSLAARLAEIPAAAFNMYGPTEASVWATAWPIESADVAIGTALAHARVHVLDEDLVPVPDGVEGQAHIGGPAVAHGYRARPQLTVDRFVPDPWAMTVGERLYATGDLVRQVNGRLHWLRRGDTQVKVNGNRIELGEIESVATGLSGVRAAVAVVAHTHERAALQLFVEGTDDGETVRRRLRARLRELLPPAMVPQRIVVMDALPLTPNGKVHRAALEAWPGAR